MNEAKLWFWVVIDAFVAVLIIVIVAVVAPSFVRYSASLAPAHTITVSSQGKTTVTPDLAELSFSVVTQGKDPTALSDNNNTKMNSVVEFLSSQAIATSDIQTISYDLEPNYQYDKNGGNATISGYTLTQGVQVKIHDLTKTASVLGGLAPLGVNQISGVTFTFEDQDSLVGPARAQAIEKAQKKAQEMASAAGASLGSIVSMSENSSTPYPVYKSVSYSTTSGTAMNSAVAPSIQAGSEDVTDTVTITYALR